MYGGAMKRSIHATFDGEVLRPEEPLELEANTRLLVTLEDDGSRESADHQEGPLLRVLALAQELDLPADYAEQLHHYRHGHPKQ